MNGKSDMVEKGVIVVLDNACDAYAKRIHVMCYRSPSSPICLCFIEFFFYFWENFP